MKKVFNSFFTTFIARATQKEAKVSALNSNILPNPITRKVMTFGATMLLTLSGSLVFGQPGSIEEVKKLIENENYNEAVAQCNQLLTKNTKDGRNFYYKGLAYFKMSMEEGQSDAARASLLASAKTTFDGAMSRNKKDPYAYIGKALYLIGTDKYEEGKKEIVTGLEFSGKDVEWLLRASEVYIAAFDFEEAKGKNKGNQTRKLDATNQASTILTKATTITDKDPHVYIELGDVYFTQQVDELAESNYKKALTLDPSNVTGHYALSKILIRQKKYKEAQAELEKVKSLDPKYTNAYRDLADLYYRFNEFKAALKEAKEWKNLIGNDKRARAKYASLLYLTNNFEEAVPELTAINKDSTSFILKRLLGYSLTETKKYPEAQQAMDEYFKMVPEGKQVFKDYKYYGLILENTNRKEEAIKNYEKAMAADPSMWELNKNIYTIHKDNKDWKNASRYLEIFMTKQTENKQTNGLTDMFMMAYLYRQPDNLNLDKASTYNDMVLAKKPDLLDALYYSANIKAQKDTSGKAAFPAYELLIKEIHKQNQVEKKKRELKEAYTFMCSYVHVEVKDNPRALMYCEKVLELDANADMAKKISAYLKGQKITAKDWATEFPK